MNDAYICIRTWDFGAEIGLVFASLKYTVSYICTWTIPRSSARRGIGRSIVKNTPRKTANQGWRIDVASGVTHRADVEYLACVMDRKTRKGKKKKEKKNGK